MAEYKAHSNRMRQLICDSMILLLEEKSFAKITVQDILHRADVQRATFYRYFRDKYEVAEAINQMLSQQLIAHAFDTIYCRAPIDEEAQLLFDAKYRKVLQQMLHLRIENVDLSLNLVNTFRETYKAHFPDCDEFESYIAGQNFLFSVSWFVDHDASLAEIRNIIASNSISRWLARFHNISPQALEEFVSQQQAKQESSIPATV